MKSFLVLPACEQGRGGGHLYRSAALVKALRVGGAEAWLFTKTPAGAAGVDLTRNAFNGDTVDFMCDSSNARGTELKRNAPNVPEDLWIDEREITQKKWTLIVLDRFRTERDELKRWAELAPVLGIDEGLSRKDCDFLIDLLPAFPQKTTEIKANLCAPSLLPLPKNRRPSFNNGTGSDSSLKILVSFGAEDAAGYTVSTALVLQKKAGSHSSLTAALGPLRKNNAADRAVLEQAGVTVIEGNDLREKLAQYDLIVTHFGITAFEALYARVPVLLINPTSYHEQLSRYAGLATAGLGQEILEFAGTSFKALYKECVEKSEKAALRWGLAPEQGENLAGLLLRAQPAVHRQCPLCGAAADRIAGRFPERTYRYCSCRNFIMDRLTAPPMEYNRDYFFAEYQKQYGKTYLEDFPQLKKAGERRLLEINALLGVKRNSYNTPPPELKRNTSNTQPQDIMRNSPNAPPPDVTRNAFNAQPGDLMRTSLNTPPHDIMRNAPNVPPPDLTRNALNTQPGDLMRTSLNTPPHDIIRNAPNTSPAPAAARLLDIGCAYGPFLAAAREAGFEAAGVDPAADAIAYVRNTLGINAVQGTFPEALPDLAATTGTENGCSAFDVVTLWYVLEHFEDAGKVLRAVNGLLKTGGVLAFATPSAAGISRRKSLRAFLEKSPVDHWTIWDPRRAGAILRRYGFRLQKRSITGHHPERFPLPLAALRVLGLPQVLSRIFGLGDTFEAYAVKVRDCEQENHG